MSEDLTLFADRSPEEIEAIFDTYIEQGFEDVPHDAFFETLALMDEKQSVRHIEIKTELVDDKVVLHPPVGIPLPFTVQGDQIILGDYHIQLQWSGLYKAPLRTEKQAA